MKPKLIRLILIQVILVVQATGCAMIPLRPELNFQKAELKGFSLTAVELRLHTEVSNPYPVTLPEAKLKLDMNIEGTRLLQLNSPNISVPAQSKGPVIFDVKIKYEDLRTIYKKVPGKEYLIIKLDGELKIPIPKKAKELAAGLPIPDELSFKFQAERKIPAVLPSIKIRNFRIIQPKTSEIKAAVASAFGVDRENIVSKASSFISSLLRKKGRSPGSVIKAGLQKLDLNIHTELELVMKNSQAARINFKNLNYTLLLNDEKFLGGESTGIKNRGTDAVITVKTSFPLKGVTASLAESIKSRQVRYRLHGGAAIAIPALQEAGLLNYKFDQKGRFNW